jgi:uncharacterized protein (TIGR02757 family)
MKTPARPAFPLRHDRVRSLELDPVRFPRRYADPRDREVAALVAATLAFGNVKAIGASVEAVLAALGKRPAKAAVEVANRKRKLPKSLYHRWFKWPELTGLLAGAGRILERQGSLEAAFMAGYEAAHEDIGPALEGFAAALDTSTFPSPAAGSACKRPCLFLRWMVRPDDGVDLGLWRGIPPAHLVVPVDVHIARVARRYGLTERKTIDWRMAREITAALRTFDAADPLRYDFDMVYADRDASTAAR